MMHTTRTFRRTPPWLVALAALLLLVPLTPAQPRAMDVNAEYHRIADGFKKLREDGPATSQAWVELGENFERLHNRAPSSQRGPDALYSAGLAYREAFMIGRDWKALSLSMDAFRRFVARYGRNRLADDSLVHQALLLERAYADLPGAIETYEVVIDRYPDGDQISTARANHETLSRRLAEINTRKEQGQATTAAARTGTSTMWARRPGNTGAQAPQAPTAAGKQVFSMETLHTAEFSRVVFTAHPDAKYTHGALKASKGAPARIYIDFEGVTPAETIPLLTPINGRGITRVRMAATPNGGARAVLDLTGDFPFEVKSFSLPQAHKIIVDLRLPPPEPVIAARPKKNDTHGHADLAALQNDRQARPPMKVRPRSGPVRRIMIDPGHGGRDPGASAFGLKEKAQVLEIAKELQNILQRRHPRVTVALTRTKDTFIPLPARPAMAKQFGADLFISIHLNASEVDRFDGVETYFLNQTSDSQSLRVAARENGESIGQANNLNAILRDLMQDSTLLESGNLAALVQQELVGNLRDVKRVRNLGVKQAPFLVLMGAEMPSILVEAGFVTNRRENRFLQSPEYLNTIAKGIYAGLRRYMDQQENGGSAQLHPLLNKEDS